MKHQAPFTTGRDGVPYSFRQFARRSALAVVGCCLLQAGAFVPAAWADAPTPPSVEERLSKLEAQLNQVRTENQALHQQLGDVASQVSASSTPSYPHVRLNVLGSVEYVFNNIKDDPNSAFIGDIDLVTTAQLNDHAGVTSDYVVASNHGGFVYEIERLFVSYKFNDAFNIDVGRFHTAMGWYNNFYHNGVYYQTTRERPLVYDFEDNGGILPVHATGISLHGAIPSGSLNLSYSFEISNGRNYVSDEHQALQIEDDNNFKAFNLQLRAKPDKFEHWEFGAGAYHDTLTPVLDPVNAPDVTTRVDQLIFTGFAIYRSPVVEWYTEAVLMGDKPVHGTRDWTFGGYTQLSKKFGKVRPYLRVQWLDAAEHDPVLAVIGQTVPWWVTQVGVRYDFTNMMALKFEYERTMPKGESSTDEFSSQLSYRF